MSWANKSRITSTEVEEKILTPDSIEILVGEQEDQVLIYLITAASAWSNVSRQLYYTYLLFQNGNQIVFQNGNKMISDSTVEGNWQNKQKI